MSPNRQPELTLQAFDEERFRERLREAIRASGRTQETIAGESGVSLSGLRKWLAGTADPGWSGIARAAKACGVSLDWLAFGVEASHGEGRQSALIDGRGAINGEMLEAAIDLIETWLHEHRRSMKPKKKAEVIGMAYEILTESGNSLPGEQDRNNVVRLLRAAS